ncbi:MAG: sensor histidine kinase [Myxococcaceae bacterium]
MRLYQQLVLFMLAATVLPLAIVGFWLLRQSEAELSRRIGAEQRALADAAAETSAAQMMGAVNALSRSAELVQWSGLSPEEAHGALSLLYQQSALVSAVLLTGLPGDGEPVFQAAGGGGHPPFDPEVGKARLTGAIPLGSLGPGSRGQVALSPAYPASGGGAAVAVAIKLEEVQARFAIAELGLSTLEASLRARAGSGGRVDLVDGGGRVIATSAPSGALTPLDPRLWAAVKANLSGATTQSFGVDLDARALVAAARVPESLGLFAVVSIDERVALAPVRALRRTVLLSIGAALGILLVLGLAFTRRLNSRLRKVTEGAEAFSRGELSKRIPVDGADELADLSGTFNRMGAELEAARARLLKWNDDLKRAVDEATAELRSAQEKLLEAQKLAAVGQLGAGVAHEINNPLCGILGNAQLLMLDRAEGDPDFATLRKIEQSAKRCKDITQNLLRFSQSQGPADLRPTDLNALIRDAAEASGRVSSGDGVTVAMTLEKGPLMVSGDPAQLTQMAGALFTNARTAMMKSLTKELSIASRREGDEVVLEVRDSGKGIKPEHVKRIFEPFFTTKDVWSNIGLGLSVAYRVLTEHHGRIEVETEVGRGSTFTVRLPKYTSDARKSGPQSGKPLNVGGQGVGIVG